MRRLISASKDTEEYLKKNNMDRLTVYSFYPIDKGNCECAKIVHDTKDAYAILPPHERARKVENQKYIVCPRSKKGMKRYEIKCNGCGDVMGYCWATSPDLSDWCDFHYVQWTDGQAWHGCLTPNISPITEELTLECTCGVDTRDFRANMTLPSKQVERLEKSNQVGRRFNLSNSKFGIKIVASNKKPVFTEHKK